MTVLVTYTLYKGSQITKTGTYRVKNNHSILQAKIRTEEFLRGKFDFDTITMEAQEDIVSRFKDIFGWNV